MSREDCPICQHPKREGIETLMRALGETVPHTLPATLARKGINVTMADLQGHQAHLNSSVRDIPETDRHVQRSIPHEQRDETSTIHDVHATIMQRLDHTDRMVSELVAYWRSLNAILLPTLRDVRDMLNKGDAGDAGEAPYARLTKAWHDAQGDQRTLGRMVDFIKEQLQQEDMGL